MITIDFDIDRTVLEEERKNPPEQDAVALGIRFMMPIRFFVDRVNVCQLPDGSPVSIALLDLSTQGLAVVENLNDGQERTYDALEDAGKYFFKRVGQQVFVTSDINNHTVMVLYDELLKALEQFAVRVRSFLLKEFPNLVHNPTWGPWFRGEKKYL